MNHKSVARLMSVASRELLMEHVDGESFLDVDVVAGERTKTRATLLDQGLLAYGSLTGNRRVSARPTLTRLTDDGRQVMVWVLAAYAEALIRAGYGVIEGTGKTPVQQTARRIAASYASPPIVPASALRPAVPEPTRHAKLAVRAPVAPDVIDSALVAPAAP